MLILCHMPPYLSRPILHFYYMTICAYTHTHIHIHICPMGRPLTRHEAASIWPRPRWAAPPPDTVRSHFNLAAPLLTPKLYFLSYSPSSKHLFYKTLAQKNAYLWVENLRARREGPFRQPCLVAPSHLCPAQLARTADNGGPFFLTCAYLC